MWLTRSRAIVWGSIRGTANASGQRLGHCAVDATLAPFVNYLGIRLLCSQVTSGWRRREPKPKLRALKRLELRVVSILHHDVWRVSITNHCHPKVMSVYHLFGPARMDAILRSSNVIELTKCTGFVVTEYDSPSRLGFSIRFFFYFFIDFTLQVNWIITWQIN